MKIIIGLMLTLTLVTMASAAQARQEGTRDPGEVRVTCQIGAAGQLEDCSVVSRLQEGAVFESAALLAASQSVARGPDGEGAHGRIHFPVRLLSEARSEANRRGPQPPVLVDPPSMIPATIPPAPADETIKAWSGLFCVFRPDGSLVRCSGDMRAAPEGVMVGAVQRIVLPDTVAGRLDSLPTDIPAPPSVVRTEWRSHGQSFGEHIYSREHSPPTAGSHLVWSATARSSADRMDYALEEYDCAGGRFRTLFFARAVSDRLRSWDMTEPGDWVSRDRLVQAYADQFSAACPA